MYKGHKVKTGQISQLLDLWSCDLQINSDHLISRDNCCINMVTIAKKRSIDDIHVLNGHHYVSKPTDKQVEKDFALASIFCSYKEV